MKKIIAIITIFILSLPNEGYCLRPIAAAVSASGAKSGPVAQIHQARRQKLKLLKGRFDELGERKSIAAEVTVLANEIYEFLQIPQPDQDKIISALSKEKQENTIEAAHIANLYKSANEFMARTGSPLVRQRAPLLLAIEYVRDRQELYPTLSKQIRDLAEQEDFNLISALDRIERKDIEALNYSDLTSIRGLVIKIFGRANEKQKRREQGKSYVEKIIKTVATLDGFSATETQVQGLKDAIFGTQEAVSKTFMRMRLDIQLYQADLEKEGRDYNIAMAADIVIYQLSRNDLQANGERKAELLNVINNLRQVTGHKPLGASFVYEETGADARYGQGPSQGAEGPRDAGEDYWSRRAREREQYERERSEREEEEITQPQREKAVEEEIERVEKMILDEGFVLKGEVKGRAHKTYNDNLAKSVFSNLDIQFPAMASFKHGITEFEERDMTIHKKTFITKRKKGERFIVYLHVVTPASYTQYIGKGYSVKVVRVDDEHAREGVYEKELTTYMPGEGMFLLDAGEKFTYDNENNRITLERLGLHITVDTKLQVAIKGITSHNLITAVEEHGRSLLWPVRFWSSAERPTASKELLFMLKQYASTADITIYGCRSSLYQYALIDDTANDRVLILNSKGGIIYSSTEKGAIDKETITFVTRDAKYADESENTLNLKRVDGAAVMLNQFGTLEEKGRKKTDVLAEEAWGLIHTQVLVECYHRLHGVFYEQRGGKEEAIEKLSTDLRDDYPNLSKDRVKTTAERALELVDEIQKAEAFLHEEVFPGYDKSAKGTIYSYQVWPHRSGWYQTYMHGHGDVEGLANNAIETLHIVGDWWGSEDESQFDMTAFEFYITDQGQLRVVCKDEMSKLEEKSERMNGISIAKLKEFLARYQGPREDVLLIEADPFASATEGPGPYGFIMLPLKESPEDGTKTFPQELNGAHGYEELLAVAA